MIETINKQPYVAPATEVVEVKTEGIVCASGDNYGNEYNIP